MPSITDHAAERRQPASTKRRRKTDQQGCHPCRNEIQQIVQPCRRASECKIACISITDHAVGRVDKLVDDDPRQARRDKPHRRGDDTVRQVLGTGLDGGAGYVIGLQFAVSRPTIMPTA